MVGLKCLHQGFLAFEGWESPSSPLSQTLEVSLDELESRETWRTACRKVTTHRTPRSRFSKSISSMRTSTATGKGGFALSEAGV